MYSLFRRSTLIKKGSQPSEIKQDIIVNAYDDTEVRPSLLEGDHEDLSNKLYSFQNGMVYLKQVEFPSRKHTVAPDGEIPNSVVRRKKIVKEVFEEKPMDKLISGVWRIERPIDYDASQLGESLVSIMDPSMITDSWDEIRPISEGLPVDHEKPTDKSDMFPNLVLPGWQNSKLPRICSKLFMESCFKLAPDADWNAVFDRLLVMLDTKDFPVFSTATKYLVEFNNCHAIPEDYKKKMTTRLYAKLGPKGDPNIKIASLKSIGAMLLKQEQYYGLIKENIQSDDIDIATAALDLKKIFKIPDDVKEAPKPKAEAEYIPRLPPRKRTTEGMDLKMLKTTMKEKIIDEERGPKEKAARKSLKPEGTEDWDDLKEKTTEVEDKELVLTKEARKLVEKQSKTLEKEEKIAIEKEKTKKEKTEKEKSGKEKTEKDKTGKEKTEKDKTGKEKTEKDKTGKEKTEKDKTGKEKTGKEKPEKEKAEKEKAEKEKAEKEKAGKEKTGKEKTEKEKTGKEKTGKEETEKEIAEKYRRKEEARPAELEQKKLEQSIKAKQEKERLSERKLAEGDKEGLAAGTKVAEEVVESFPMEGTEGLKEKAGVLRKKPESFKKGRHLSKREKPKRVQVKEPKAKEIVQSSSKDDDWMQRLSSPSTSVAQEFQSAISDGSDLTFQHPTDIVRKSTVSKFTVPVKMYKINKIMKRKALQRGEISASEKIEASAIPEKPRKRSSQKFEIKKPPGYLVSDAFKKPDKSDEKFFKRSSLSSRAAPTPTQRLVAHLEDPTKSHRKCFDLEDTQNLQTVLATHEISSPSMEEFVPIDRTSWKDQPILVVIEDLTSPDIPGAVPQELKIPPRKEEAKDQAEPRAVPQEPEMPPSKKETKDQVEPRAVPQEPEMPPSKKETKDLVEPRAVPQEPEMPPSKEEAKDQVEPDKTEKAEVPEKEIMQVKKEKKKKPKAEPVPVEKDEVAVAPAEGHEERYEEKVVTEDGKVPVEKGEVAVAPAEGHEERREEKEVTEEEALTEKDKITVAPAEGYEREKEEEKETVVTGAEEKKPADKARLQPTEEKDKKKKDEKAKQKEIAAPPKPEVPPTSEVYQPKDKDALGVLPEETLEIPHAQEKMKAKDRVEPEMTIIPIVKHAEKISFVKKMEAEEKVTETDQTKSLIPSQELISSQDKICLDSLEDIAQDRQEEIAENLTDSEMELCYLIKSRSNQRQFELGRYKHHKIMRDHMTKEEKKEAALSDTLWVKESERVITATEEKANAFERHQQQSQHKENPMFETMEPSITALANIRLVLLSDKPLEKDDEIKSSFPKKLVLYGTKLKALSLGSIMPREKFFPVAENQQYSDKIWQEILAEKRAQLLKKKLDLERKKEMREMSKKEISGEKEEEDESDEAIGLDQELEEVLRWKPKAVFPQEGDVPKRDKQKSSESEWLQNQEELQRRMKTKMPSVEMYSIKAASAEEAVTSEAGIVNRSVSSTRSVAQYRYGYQKASRIQHEMKHKKAIEKLNYIEDVQIAPMSDELYKVTWQKSLTKLRQDSRNKLKLPRIKYLVKSSPKRSFMSVRRESFTLYGKELYPPLDDETVFNPQRETQLLIEREKIFSKKIKPLPEIPKKYRGMFETTTEEKHPTEVVGHKRYIKCLPVFPLKDSGKVIGSKMTSKYEIKQPQRIASEIQYHNLFLSKKFNAYRRQSDYVVQKSQIKSFLKHSKPEWFPEDKKLMYSPNYYQQPEKTPEDHRRPHSTIY